MRIYSKVSRFDCVKNTLADSYLMCACGCDERAGRLARIFYDDGRGELAKKSDAIVLEISDGFVRFIDLKSRTEMLIPLSRIYRIILIGDGKNDTDRLVQ